MKKPRWLCRNRSEVNYFAEWTKAKLDQQFEEAGPSILDEEEVRVIEGHAARQLAHGRRISAIEQAVKANDIDALVRLTDQPQLRRLAFQYLRPGRGRKPGQRRHGREYSDTERVILEEASIDVERIRDLWQAEFHRRNRSHSPSAIAIAAAIWQVEEEDLIKFRKG